MKKMSFLVIVAMVMIGVAFAACDSGKTVSLKKDIDSASYIIGASYGVGVYQQAKQFPGAATNPLNMDAVAKGFADAVSGDSIFLGMEMNEAGQFVNDIFLAIQAAEAEEDSKKAELFLAENAKQSGVITTESGLQYKVLTEGTGPKPTLTDVVRVNYVLSFLNGEVFDNTDGRGPADLMLSDLIQGWIEGMQLMPVGSKYMFWIRQEIGFPAGHQLSGKFLIFEIELLEIIQQ